jgi:asparagine synthase (glutamine-hydrolysing)
MCGIAGYFWLDESAAPLPGELNKMNEKLHHRGPDAGNIFAEHKVGLAHRRLSIIDLSAHANQPFITADKRFVTIYNGEVYNYRELSGRLRVKPHTHSDTEIIAELYAAEGHNMCPELDGMFALAIYDKEKERLFLTRDFAGIKPLYYFFDGKLFAFASEIKALKEISYIRTRLEPDMNAISSFLNLGYVPKPRSAYKQIKKFPSGAYLYIDENTQSPDFVKFKIEEELFHEKITINFTQAKNKLKELLETSVSNRLIADVPVGSFLSGGVDSGIITAMAGRFPKA